MNKHQKKNNQQKSIDFYYFDLYSFHIAITFVQNDMIALWLYFRSCRIVYTDQSTETYSIMSNSFGAE